MFISFSRMHSANKNEEIRETNNKLNRLLDSSNYIEAINMLESFNKNDNYFKNVNNKLDSVRLLQRRAILFSLDSLGTELKNGVDYEEYYLETGDIDSVTKNLLNLWRINIIFNSRVEILNSSKDLIDYKSNHLIEEVTKLCIREQVREFPRMRKQYSEILEKALRGTNKDMKVIIYGDKGSSIEFISNIFEPEYKFEMDNIIEMTQVFLDVFRFNKLSFKKRNTAIPVYFDLDFISDEALLIK